MICTLSATTVTRKLVTAPLRRYCPAAPLTLDRTVQQVGMVLHDGMVVSDTVQTVSSQRTTQISSPFTASDGSFSEGVTAGTVNKW
jgi:hypothetical protein